MLSQLP
jgi:hypothetical protein